MNKKKLVGITGGIGAGKSIICRIIHAMGYPVFYSDIEAKKLLNTNLSLKSQIEVLFGPEAYKNGELNRPFIAELLFTNQELLTKMNAIVHPAVREAFDQWATAQKSPIVFNEAAILFETGAYHLYDQVVLVTAPISIRIKRVQQRDSISEDSIKERMAKQWSDEKKEPLADYLILNDNASMLIPQVIELLNKLQE